MNNFRRVSSGLLVFTIALPLLFVPGERAAAFGYGARGPDVYAVQGMLKSLGYYAGRIDGIYGPLTESGVKQFQMRYGLPQTGNVDGRTLQSILWAYAELKIPSPGTPSQPPEQREPPDRHEPGKEEAPGEKAPDETKPPDTDGISAEERRLADLMNAERTRRGLAPLTLDADLSRVAEIKSAEMAERGYFSHQSPVYGSPFEMMKRFGIPFRTAGENIACNRSVDAAHQSLMASQGHRENILNSQFERVGIGIVDGGPCGKLFTQLFAGN